MVFAFLFTLSNKNFLTSTINFKIICTINQFDMYFSFQSGAPVGSITCGNGAVSMLMFRNKYMFVGCYDGFIYIIDKVTGRQVTRLTGSGKMILTLEIVGDKVSMNYANMCSLSTIKCFFVYYCFSDNYIG